MIALCRAWGWGYRLRLKEALLVRDADGAETTLGECAERGETTLTGIALTKKAVPTNVAILHEPGHAEPPDRVRGRLWIIAIGEKPGKYKALDYGMRWSIVAMFSDFKTRGFGIEDTKLHYPDRVERLILFMAVALYWAVSTGMWDAHTNPTPAKKRPARQAEESRPIPDLLLQTRPPRNSPMPAHRNQSPRTLADLDKLRDGKVPSSLQNRVNHKLLKSLNHLSDSF